MELFPVPHEIMSHSKSITVEETFSCLSQLQTQDTFFAPRSVTFRREGGARHFHADQQGSLSCVMSSCVCIILYLWTYQLKSGSYLVIFGNICAAAAACGTYLECRRSAWLWVAAGGPAPAGCCRSTLTFWYIPRAWWLLVALHRS